MWTVQKKLLQGIRRKKRVKKSGVYKNVFINRIITLSKKEKKADTNFFEDYCKEKSSNGIIKAKKKYRNFD